MHFAATIARCALVRNHTHRRQNGGVQPELVILLVLALPRFAYGQSGCGKSYSVVGDPPNVGIIPRTVTAVFEVVDGNTDPDVRYNAPLLY